MGRTVVAVCLAGVLVSLLHFQMFLPQTQAIALRPFKNCKTNASACSSETALSAYGCPCKLNGQRCLATGVKCINSVCACGPAYLNITTNGVTNCIPALVIVPIGTCVSTVLDTPANIPLKSCSLSSPGYPINCGPTILTVQSFQTDDPTFPDVNGNPIPAALVNQIVPNTGNNPNQYPLELTNYIQISSTGGVVANQAGAPFNQPCIGPAPPGTYFRQTYSGFCVNPAGISSNTFTFSVTWTKRC